MTQEHRSSHPKLYRWSLVVTLLFAGCLRFVSLDWDQGQHLHPDERFLTMVETAIEWPSSPGDYFDERESTLNPRNVGFNFFAYGTFPLYLVKAVSVQIGMSDYDQVYLVGRFLSGLFDLGTVLLIFFFARLLYIDRRVGLLAAALYGMAVLPIQHAHFFVVDSFSAFFTLACLYYAVRIQQYGRASDYVLAGTFFGLALACKVSVFLLVLPVLAATVVHFRRPSRHEQDKAGSSFFEAGLSRLFLFSMVVFLIFRVFQPYAFEGPGFLGMLPSGRWLENLLEVRALVSGDIDFPPGHQWTDRAPLWFPLKNMLIWGLGLPLGIIGWCGWGIGLVRLFRQREVVHLVPVLWIGTLFLYQGTSWAKSMRYFLPIYPLIAVMAAWLLIWLIDRAKSRQTEVRNPWLRRVGNALLIGTLFSTGLWAIAFTTIYFRPHTRVEASAWIYQNLPSGVTIGNEHWDDALPLPVPGYDPNDYPRVEMRWYDPDTEEKWDQAVEWLDRADYIVLSSNRLYDSIPRLPRRYPMTSKYYRFLFDGSLGWNKVAEFSSFPGLFALSFPDVTAEEAFTVYDHPRVLIFAKAENYDSNRTRELLRCDFESRIEMSPRQATETRHGLLLAPERWERQQQGGSWSLLFDRQSLSNRFPVTAWIMVLEILGLLAFPILLPFTENLADKGYSLAKTGGLLLLAWLGWFVSSVQITDFSKLSLFGCLIFIGLLGAAFAWRSRYTIRDIWNSHRDVILVEELLFLILFLLFVLIRAANPDLWHPWRGGEKPMDFSYLNAVVKSISFPPYDPWFAAGYINYYYFGFVIYGAIIKLTGMIPEVGYNLAIPTLFSLTALGSFGVVLNLVSLSRGMNRKQALGFACLGGFFVAIAGNLGLVRLFWQRLVQLGQFTIDTTFSGLETVLKGAQGLYMTLLGGTGLPGWPDSWYWSSSRQISHLPAEPAPITEFPFFSFLFADLHAHVMALPLALFCLGLSVCLVSSQKGKLSTKDTANDQADWEKKPRTGSGSRPERWWSFPLLLLWLSLILGSLWATNTWDVPTYALVILAALLVRFTPTKQGAVAAGSAMGLILVVSGVLFAPFHYWYVSPVEGIRLWDGSVTPLVDFLTVFGVFLFFISSMLWFALSRFDRLPYQLRILIGSISHVWRIKRYGRLRRRFTGAGLLEGWKIRLTAIGILIALSAVLTDYRVFGLTLLLLVLVCLLLRQKTFDRPAKFVLAITAIGLLLAMAVEVIVVEGDVGRMNSVFKSYLQIWVLWGVAAAFTASEVWKWRPLSRRVGFLWLAGMILLLLAASAYPLVGTYARVQDRFGGVESWTLNGAIFMDSAEFDYEGALIPLVPDRKAVDWLRERAVGTPVVAEANTHPALYRWGNRISMFTGLPSIVGWDWHQRQQRGQVPGGLVEKRIVDVNTLFNTTDLNEAHRLLSRYQVQWVVVGPLERAIYNVQGLAKFSQHDGTYWRKAYETEGLVIYQVLD